MKFYTELPISSTLYQGLPDSTATDNWVTSDRTYALSYARGKNGILKQYTTKKPLKLLQIYNMTADDFDNERVVKDFSFNDTIPNLSISMTLRDLFKIVTGKGCLKVPALPNKESVGNLYNQTYFGTQYFYQYLLHVYFNKKAEFEKWYNIISNNPTRAIIIEKDAVNRISVLEADQMFVDALQVCFPEYDGYIANQVPSDWHLYDSKWEQPGEIALFDKVFTQKYVNTSIASENKGGKSCKVSKTFSSKYHKASKK